jgi:Tfp pilus assembly protein PilF
VVQLDPKDEDNYLDMAEIYAEQGQASKVEELTGKAVSYAPKKNVLLRAGLAFLKAGQPAKAEEYFNRSFQAAPDDEDLYVDAGLAYLEKGDTQKAAQLFAKGINLKPKKEKLYLKIGQAYVKKT